jgi:RNA recognition motif-containing protein
VIRLSDCSAIAFGTQTDALNEASIPEEIALMGRRLYVGNLAWTVTDQDLQDVFSEAGTVDSSQVIIDRATNRSRGFGFVEMATDEAAESAIKTLNGRDIKGRPIRVNEAQARTGGGGGMRGSGSGRDRDR